MELPDHVNDAWVDATVPGLTLEERTELARALRERGWAEAADRVVSRRDHSTAPDPRTAAETEVDPQSAAPVPIAPGLTPGTAFAGYLIEGVAGRGGMGVVYRARETRPARTVALKVMSHELATDAEFRVRFERESDIAATIEHSNVLPIFRVGEEAGLLYIAMRYVEGTDLAKMIAALGRLEPRRGVAIIEQVCDALDAAHARGLVHRDVKPANVLIAPEGGKDHVYLTDFGIAKRHDATSGPTMTGYFMGTLDYAAPEQFESKPLDARTDIYATGCMLYHALAGRVPFPAENPGARMFAHLSAAPPVLRDVDPKMPAALDVVITRAMAKDPDDRYLSAGDLGRAAQTALQGQSMTRAEHSVAIGEAAGGGAINAETVDRSKSLLPGGGGSRRGLVMIAAAGAVALTLGGMWVLRARPFNSGSSTTAAAQIRACMAQHHLSKAHQTTDQQPAGQAPPTTQAGDLAETLGKMVFASCDWPAPATGSRDGYNEIRTTAVTGPGKSDASDADVAERIETTCSPVMVNLQFAHMGEFQTLPPFVLTKGQIVNADGSPWQTHNDSASGTLPFYPGVDEIVVVHGGHEGLSAAGCAPPHAQSQPIAKVRLCMAQHHLVLPHAEDAGAGVSDFTANTSFFRTCDWPPPTGGSKDGYNETKVTKLSGQPGSDGSRSEVERIAPTTCSAVKLTYAFVSSARPGVETRTPVLLRKGVVANADGSPWHANPSEGQALPFSPRPDEVVVVAGHGYVLSAVDCAP